MPTGRSIELFHRNLSMSIALRCAVGVPLMLMVCHSVDTRLDKTQEPSSRGGRSNDRSREGVPWVGVPSCDGALFRKLRLQNVSKDFTVGLKTFSAARARLCYRAELRWHAISEVQDNFQNSLS